MMPPNSFSQPRSCMDTSTLTESFGVGEIGGKEAAVAGARCNAPSLRVTCFIEQGGDLNGKKRQADKDAAVAD